MSRLSGLTGIDPHICAEPLHTLECHPCFLGGLHRLPLRRAADDVAYLGVPVSAAGNRRCLQALDELARRGGAFVGPHRQGIDQGLLDRAREPVEQYPMRRQRVDESPLPRRVIG